MTDADLMAPPDARDRLHASKEALKLIYYVVIGIAITDALDHAFAPGGVFLGKQVRSRAAA